MTSRAGVVAAGEVFKCPGRTDLSLLWQSCSVVMTVGAIEPLTAAVLRMTESETERGGVGRSPAVRFLIVTNTARCQVASIGLRVRSMTGVALVMRREVCRNRKRHPASQRRGVTRGASIFWARRAGQVLGMIELQVEAFFEFVRESFERRIIAIHVRVADRAHGHIRSGELRQMTAGAIFVAGEAGPRGIIIPMMTTRAGSRCVTRTGVQEFRVVEIVSLRIDQGKRQKEKAKVKRHSQKLFLRANVDIFILPSYFFLACSLCCRFMTSRRLLLPHIRRVAISAVARLLKLLELFLDRRDFRIGRFLVVLVTSNAGGDRNVGS